MKTLVAFAAVCCALFIQCHCQPAARPRHKRTLRMLESLIGTMRDTLSPLTAPEQPPPPPPPPPNFILTTKYPVGVKYALYPTVRMHIRPVQQHVIYMQTIPAMPPPILRAARPLNTGGGNVEIVRHVQPMVRLPKTKTTTTIHYEIIPLPVPVPVHSVAPAPAPLPPPAPPPPPSSSSLYDESDEPPHVPWSLDELPPPVPTSMPVNPSDEPNVPWHMHALPPPIATKQPRHNQLLDWSDRPTAHQNLGSPFMIPVFNKKLVIPAQNENLRSRHHSVFRPSPLQSEIIVQPSVEVAAYSETQTLAQQPNEYSDRLHRLNNPKPQVFSNYKNRPRRDTSSIDDVPYLANFNHRLADNSKFQSSPETPAFFGAKSFETTADEEKFSNTRQTFRPEPFKTSSTAAKSYSNTKPAFGSAYKDGGDTSSEYSSPPMFLRNATSAEGDIRMSEWLSDSSTAEHFVLITPRPVNYTRRLLADPLKTDSQQPKGYSSRLPAALHGQQPPNLDIFQSATYEDKKYPRQRDVPDYFEPSSSSKGRLRFPHTGLLSKGSPSRRQQQQHRSVFSDSKSPLSVDHFFDDRPATKFGAGGATSKSHLDAFLGSDYDNVEYFEPIVIDIDDEKRKDDFGPKVKFKFKNFELKKSAREPLRLPSRLHETIDQLRGALIMHPPVFDMESEANEPEAVIVVLANEIT